MTTEAAFAPFKSRRIESAWACETFEHMPLPVMGSTPSGNGNRARGAEAIDVPRTAWLADLPRLEPPVSCSGMSTAPGRLREAVA